MCLKIFILFPGNKSAEGISTNKNNHNKSKYTNSREFFIKISL